MKATLASLLERLGAPMAAALSAIEAAAPGSIQCKVTAGRLRPRRSQCMATTAKGAPCKRSATAGGLCPTHVRQGSIKTEGQSK